MTLVIGNVLTLRGVMTGPQVGLALLVVSALLHQGLIAALIGTALVLRYGIRRALWASPSQKLMLAASGGLFLSWAWLGVSAGKRWIEISGSASWMGAIRRTFFSFPSWTEALVQPWSADLPVLGVIDLCRRLPPLLMSRLSLLVDRTLPRASRNPRLWHLGLWSGPLYS